MSWHVALYNKVQDRLVYVETLDDDDGVPDVIFDEITVNGELTAYFHYRKTDASVRWGMWNTKRGEWQSPEVVPEVVQLLGVIAE